MDLRKLPLRDLLRRPGRSLALLTLVALLAVALFGGTVVISSLESGVESLEGRVGADVIVVPYSAKTKTDLSKILLQGTTGYFYMDSRWL